jgi:hypothetical protein
MADVIGASLAKPEGFKRLVVSLPVAIDPAAALGVLELPDWLGPEVVAASGNRRYLGDLEFSLFTKPHTVVFRKAALFDLGPVRRLPDGSALLEIAWRSATLAPLFPVFSGRLLVRTDGLFLDGAYAPPFGEFGRLIDRAALHQVALRTARWFLRTVASQLNESSGSRNPDGAGSVNT